MKVSYQFGPQHVDLGFLNRQFITGCMSGEIDVYKRDKRSRRHLIRIATTSYEGRRLKWKELGQLAGLEVSEKTIKRACEKEGYHKCKACRKPFLSVKTRQIHRHFARVYGKMGPLLAKNYVVR